MRPSPTLLAAIAAGLLAIALPLGGGAYRDDHVASAGIVIGLLLISAALLDSRRIDAALRDRRMQALIAAIAVVLLDTAVRAATSPIEDAARAKLLVATIAAASFAALAAISSASERAARLAADGIVLGITAIAVLAIARADVLSGGMTWPFANHGQLGGLFASGAVLAFRVPGRDQIEARHVVRIGVAAFLGVAAAATQSRSAFVALAAAGFVSAAPLVRRRTLAVISAALVAAVLWVGAEGRWNPVHAAGTGPIQDRLAVWSASVRLSADAPLTGIGLGAYGSAIWRHTPESVGGAIENAHSHALETLAERGVIGALGVAVLIGLAFRCARGPGSLPRRAALSSGALLAQSLVDVALATPGLVFLAAATLGIACGVSAQSRGSLIAALGEARRTRFAISAVGGACVLLAAQWMALSFERARSQRLMEHGERRAAIEAAHASLRRFPADRISMRRLAESGELAHYQTLAQLDPFDPYAALGRAAWLEHDGRMDEAEAEIRRARLLFPAGHAPRAALVSFFARNGRIAEAIEETRGLANAHPDRAVDAVVSIASALDNPFVAEELAPADPSQRRRVAEWLIGRGEPLPALRLLEGDEDARLLRARAALAAGRREEARVLLAPISADPKAASVLADLARSPAEIDEAVAALERMTSAEGAAKLVALLDRAERVAEADAALEKAMVRLPDSVVLLEMRLTRSSARGDIASAMADARRLIELRPHDVRGRLALAKLYEARGMTAGARDLYSEALQVAPENPEARAALARLSAP